MHRAPPQPAAKHASGKHASGKHATRSIDLRVVLGISATALVLAAGLLFLLLQGGDGRRGRVPVFTFRLGNVLETAVDGHARKAELRGSAERVRDTLDRLYVGAFVDPEQWEDGRFSGIGEAFAGPAADRARSDLAELTLGGTADRLDDVGRPRGNLDVRFLLDKEGRLFAAVANARFSARGRLADGGALSIHHRGRYVMRPIDGAWKIVGYRVDGKIQPADVGKRGGKKDGAKGKGGGKDGERAKGKDGGGGNGGTGGKDSKGKGGEGKGKGG